MKILLLAFLIALFFQASLLAEDTLRFPSPDGRFAFLFGAPERRHYDAATKGWVTDHETVPATLVEQATRRVVSKLEVPLRPGEDRALWSADSQRVAVSVPANKFVRTKVFLREGEGFAEVGLPFLGELEIEVKPARRGQGEGQARLDYDKALPVRWLESGSLVLSRDLCLSTVPDSGRIHARKALYTIGFNAAREASILETVPEKQRTSKRR